MPTVVLITGLPATGKTTLAKELAERHRFPLFQKDAFKEAMYEALHPEGDYERMERGFQARLGAISNSSLGVAIRATVEAEQSAIFESNFDRRLFSPVLARIYERVPFYTVQAHLVCQGEVLVERFRRREIKDRHAGHQGLRDLDRITKALLAGPDEAVDIPEGKTFRFDTTDLERCDFEPFFEAVARRLGARDTI